MPKLRNHPTDMGKFMQWLGRKCKNHHPLAETLKPLSARAGLPNQSRLTPAQKQQVSVYMMTDRDDAVVYEVNGTAYLITVEQLPADVLEHKQRIQIAA